MVIVILNNPLASECPGFIFNKCQVLWVPFGKVLNHFNHVLNWVFDRKKKEKGSSACKDISLGLHNVSTRESARTAHCLWMKFNLWVMSHLWGSFLLRRPCCHSWDQQDVIQIPSLWKTGPWQASLSQSLSFHLVPNSLNLVICQVHWKRHLSVRLLGGRKASHNVEKERKVHKCLRW